MNNLAVAVEHQVPNPILGYIPPELLAMAKELHRLREAGSAGKTFSGIEAAQGSKLLRRAFGDHLFNSFLRNKRIEWERYCSAVTDFEMKTYLPLL